MKPVGVLTFIQTMNYGAELQGFALKRTIEHLGYSSEMVSYVNGAVANREAVRLPGVADLAHPRRLVKMLINYQSNKKRFEGCRSFSNTHNAFGVVIDSLKGIYDIYDAVVVGSDQVWNPKLTDGDATYFLPQVGAKSLKKIAYAASCGEAFDVLEHEGSYREMIEGFDAVGIRESYAADKLRKMLDCEIESVLDPTLLVDSAEWSTIEKSPDAPDDFERFVFVYLVAEHEKALEYACRVAAERNLKVLAIDSMGLPKKGVTYVNDASPEIFLWYVHHADCVVTSSFHGTCFSVLYGKEFWYSLPEGSDRSKSRIVDLLDRLGARGGEVHLDGSAIAPISVDSSSLQMQREASLHFLENALAALKEEK